jgi:hypothetical protein
MICCFVAHICLVSLWCRSDYEKIASELLLVKGLSRHAGGENLEGMCSRACSVCVAVCVVDDVLDHCRSKDVSQLLTFIYMSPPGVLSTHSEAVDRLEKRFTAGAVALEQQTAEVDVLLDQYEKTVSRASC